MTTPEENEADATMSLVAAPADRLGGAHAEETASLDPAAAPGRPRSTPADAADATISLVGAATGAEETRSLHGGDADRTATLWTAAVPDARASAAEERDASPVALPRRYRDLGPIASGAFGDVRRVWDSLLERAAAMKVLRLEYAGSAAARRRFLAEALVTAQLQHPGIVAIYDRGELADGRLWFAMKEVRGRTLGAVIQEVHAEASAEGFRETASGWTFRRLIDAFSRIAQAVGYAHSRGVVHRDLKPENTMAGEFGEVLVMDWGLARRIGEAEIEAPEAPRAASAAGRAEVTRLGDVLGTPAYMPPEQARGQRDLHGPESDVYALGAILYHILSGQAPYRAESAMAAWRKVLLGPPPALAEVTRGRPQVPGELVAICERAMRREMGERYPNAEVLAREVVAWLDGARRREQALGALAQAGAGRPEIAGLRERAARAQAEARAMLAAARTYDAVEKKQPGWDLEDEAARLNRDAALRETDWLERVHGALNIDPELPEGHALLADHYRERLVDAELSHRGEDAARFEVLLRAHDRGRYAAFLRGDGALSLVTDPPGASVLLERYVLRGRRLVAEPVREIGPTPIRGVPLERGSYLLRIRAPGRVEVRYPVLIDRDSHWDGCPPGESEPFPVALPREEEVGPDEVVVPAGWCWTGGDALAMDGLPRRRVWIDGFVIGRFPVTNAEYIEFLNDLVAAGREGEALAACPHVGRSASEATGRIIYGRDRAGRFSLTEGEPSEIWPPDWPAVLIDWHGACAYVRWLEEKTGRPYRLPDELEREKAARGVDGRYFPWGNHFDATWACIIDSHTADPTRVGVEDHPLDESPYGVRGLAGNVRDWCNNVWLRDGSLIGGERLRLSPAMVDDPEFRAVRGGAWKSLADLSRAAGRFASRPGHRWPTTGLRVARAQQGMRHTCMPTPATAARFDCS